MSKITFFQKKFILDLKLRTEKEADNMTKTEATELLNEEVPKFHARKLQEWKVKSERETALMFPNELKKFYSLHRQLRKLSSLKESLHQLKESLDQYEVGEEVWYKQIIGKKEKKITCTITAIRYPEHKGRYLKHLNLNITVRLPDGKKKAVCLSRIEKNKTKEEKMNIPRALKLYIKIQEMNLVKLVDFINSYFNDFLEEKITREELVKEFEIRNFTSEEIMAFALVFRTAFNIVFDLEFANLIFSLRISTASVDYKSPERKIVSRLENILFATASDEELEDFCILYPIVCDCFSQPGINKLHHEREKLISKTRKKSTINFNVPAMPRLELFSIKNELKIEP